VKATVRGKHARVYTPKDADTWKDRVFLMVRDAMQLAGWDGPLRGPVAMELEYRFPRPMSHYGTGRNAGKVKASAPTMLHAVKPDGDNLEKATLDALEGLLFVNDAQVASMCRVKKYVRGLEEEPGLLLRATA
jgi:Holliday junction resolvase RusA-like endonuclease